MRKTTIERLIVNYISDVILYLTVWALYTFLLQPNSVFPYLDWKQILLAFLIINFANVDHYGYWINKKLNSMSRK